MREELVCRLFVLSAGRMAAEERLCHSTHGWVRECAAHLWGFLGWMTRMAGEARNVLLPRMQCAGDLGCLELKSRSHHQHDQRNYCTRLCITTANFLEVRLRSN